MIAKQYFKCFQQQSNASADRQDLLFLWLMQKLQRKFDLATPVRQSDLSQLDQDWLDGTILKEGR